MGSTTGPITPGAAGCPVLMVDRDTVRLTMAEMIGLGLVRGTRGGARKE